MKKRVGLVTLYTGFNYGSSLQAYATKHYLASLGYDVDLLGIKGSIIEGRDVRIGKLFVMFRRTIFRPVLLKKTFIHHKSHIAQKKTAEVIQAFKNFEKNVLQPRKMIYREIKKYANDNLSAILCGSDQIWGSTNVYVDPVNYLRFVERNKRIAFAPSFGNSTVPKYNEKLIKKYVSDFDSLSVREEEGAKIIRSFTGKDVPVLIDPTLLLNKEEWMKLSDGSIEGKYILLYFLNKPTDIALRYIKEIQLELGCNTYAILHNFGEFKVIKDFDYIDAGPKEFVALINSATYICTDSFHGTAFSVNFNKQFYVFERDYTTNGNQSSRVANFLLKFKILDRFIKKDENIVDVQKVDFSVSNEILEGERRKSYKYLADSLEKAEKSDI